MWHVPDKGSQLGCHIRPVNSGDTDLVSSSGPTWQRFMFPAVVFRGALWWGGWGSFNQHDEPCHPLRMHMHTLTHTWGEWAHAEGQWAGLCAIISPNLHGELLTHVWGASFDLQKAHPHYAEAAVSLPARLSAAWGKNWRKGVHGCLGEWERAGTDRQKQELVLTLIPMRFFWCHKSSKFYKWIPSNKWVGLEVLQCPQCLL